MLFLIFDFDFDFDFLYYVKILLLMDFVDKNQTIYFWLLIHQDKYQPKVVKNTNFLDSLLIFVTLSNLLQNIFYKRLNEFQNNSK